VIKGFFFAQTGQVEKKPANKIPLGTNTPADLKGVFSPFRSG
jgi:hypothetical protein